MTKSEMVDYLDNTIDELKLTLEEDKLDDIEDIENIVELNILKSIRTIIEQWEGEDAKE